jgi:hypothetical protein
MSQHLQELIEFFNELLGKEPNNRNLLNLRQIWQAFKQEEANERWPEYAQNVIIYLREFITSLSSSSSESQVETTQKAKQLILAIQFKLSDLETDVPEIKQALDKIFSRLQDSYFSTEASARKLAFSAIQLFLIPKLGVVIWDKINNLLVLNSHDTMKSSGQNVSMPPAIAPSPQPSKIVASKTCNNIDINQPLDSQIRHLISQLPEEKIVIQVELIADSFSPKNQLTNTQLNNFYDDDNSFKEQFLELCTKVANNFDLQNATYKKDMFKSDSPLTHFFEYVYPNVKEFQDLSYQFRRRKGMLQDAPVPCPFFSCDSQQPSKLRKIEFTNHVVKHLQVIDSILFYCNKEIDWKVMYKGVYDITGVRRAIKDTYSGIEVYLLRVNEKGTVIHFDRKGEKTLKKIPKKIPKEIPIFLLGPITIVDMVKNKRKREESSETVPEQNNPEYEKGKVSKKATTEKIQIFKFDIMTLRRTKSETVPEQTNPDHEEGKESKKTITTEKIQNFKFHGMAQKRTKKEQKIEKSPRTVTEKITTENEEVNEKNEVEKPTAVAQQPTKPFESRDFPFPS